MSSALPRPPRFSWPAAGALLLWGVATFAGGSPPSRGEPAAADAPSPAAPPFQGFCDRIDSDPARAREELRSLASALAGEEAALAGAAEFELRSCTRERSRRLAAGRGWSPAETEALAVLLLAEPERFVAEEAFRRRILAFLPTALDPRTPPALRDDLLGQLNEIRGFDFEASDALEFAWGRAPRRALERRAAPKTETPAKEGGGPPARPPFRFDADTSGRIAASVYSLPSFFFSPATVRELLLAISRLDPRREILVLADLAMVRALGAAPPAPRLHLLETYGRPYSPWPRDPFSLVRDSAGRLVALARPNSQTGREEDANLAAEWVQNLPADLDRKWGGKGGVVWTVAPTPFHNGQVLLTEDAAWMTVHALEPRVLALLGAERVPVESFGSAEGIDRYLRAVDQASGELAALYGRPVRFVHPLPRAGTLAERTALLRTLGGAAGYDLDSLVTFVPAKGGVAALVADSGLGRGATAQAGPRDLEALRAGFGLAPEGEGLRAALLAAQESPATRALGAFLDLAARSLQEAGFPVRRLPLLSIPTALLAERAGLHHEEFLLTWNNVVVERRPEGARAEGFSYHFPPGDRAAREAFEGLGVHLDLLPPLARSIVLNGGYRCASNHLRERP